MLIAIMLHGEVRKNVNMTVSLRLAPADVPTYQFLDRKRAEGKPYYVYMTAGANKFLCIYFGKVRDHLVMLDAASHNSTSVNL